MCKLKEDLGMDIFSDKDWLSRRLMLERAG